MVTVPSTFIQQLLPARAENRNFIVCCSCGVDRIEPFVAVKRLLGPIFNVTLYNYGCEHILHVGHAVNWSSIYRCWCYSYSSVWNIEVYMYYMQYLMLVGQAEVASSIYWYVETIYVSVAVIVYANTKQVAKLWLIHCIYSIQTIHVLKNQWTTSRLTGGIAMHKCQTYYFLVSQIRMNTQGDVDDNYFIILWGD